MRQQQRQRQYGRYGRKHPGPNFSIPGQGNTVTLPTGKAFYVLASIVAVGTFTCVLFALGTLILAAYVLNIAISAGVELVTHVSSVYGQSNDLFKLIVWICIALILVKLTPWMWRRVLRWK